MNKWKSEKAESRQTSRERKRQREYIIVSNHFILVTVAVDPEPISGTLSGREEYTLVHLHACFWEVDGNQRTQRKEHAKLPRQ